MIIAIHQPNLFPRLKVLQKLALCDIWIVLDDVQFEQREYQNRALIVPNHKHCHPHWLTLPVRLPLGQKTRINAVEMAEGHSLKRISNAILLSFKGDATLSRNRKYLLDAISSCGENLVQLAIHSTLGMLRISGYEPRVIMASSLSVSATSKSLRLLELCRRVGATSYLSDSGGAQYLDETPFHEAQIGLLWHVWRNPLGFHSLALGDHIRNGSALNLLLRSNDEFLEVTANPNISRQRHWASGQ